MCLLALETLIYAFIFHQPKSLIFFLKLCPHHPALNYNRIDADGFNTDCLFFCHRKNKYVLGSKFKNCFVFDNFSRNYWGLKCSNFTMHEYTIRSMHECRMNVNETSGRLLCK